MPRTNSFKKDRERSVESMLLAVEYYFRKGIPVTLNPFNDKLDDMPFEYQKYADKGDLTISFVVEVRHRQGDDMNFTNAQDFKYDDMLVEQVDTYEAKGEEPRVYLIYNEPLTYVAKLITVKTKEFWTKRTILKTDRGGKKYPKECYFCPIHLFTFEKV